MSYYQTIARVDRITENGEQKKVSEKYLVDALTCLEAIELTTDNMGQTSPEFEIIEVKKTAIAEIFGDMQMCAKFFIAKVNIVNLNEHTGKEKKTAYQWFVGADDYDMAKALVTGEIKKSMADIEIAGITESPIIGFIPAKL